MCYICVSDKFKRYNYMSLISPKTVYVPSYTRTPMLHHAYTRTRIPCNRSKVKQLQNILRER